MSVKINVNPLAILNSRGLGSSTKAKRHMASTVARLSEPYTPMSAGSGAHMVNDRKVITAVEGSAVALFYSGPYAHYQYKGEVMAGRAPKHYTGRPIKYTDGDKSPMRGKEWDKRMMADRGDEVVDDLAKFVGGKRK